jgi:primosomal protein N' (replication factor Y) (superfamily II helicase)
MTYTYVEVMVADSTYHGQEALTYYSTKRIPVGAIVKVQIRDKNVLGFVVSITKKPRFPVKQVEYPEMPPLPRELIELHNWLRVYYPAPLGIINGLFLPSGNLPKMSAGKEDSTDNKPENLPPLTADQKQAINQLQNPGLHILHGETGTGKTRVYIELAKKSLASGKSAMILTPEIGLTSQLIKSLQSVFSSGSIVLLHSQMTDSSRKKAWIKVLTNDQPLIIVGPRSALFSPITTLGLIVVDEFHETAYKQDRAPYYNAIYVAAKLASIHQATLILGSATPSVADYALANQRKLPIVRMLQTANSSHSSTPEIQVVDIRDRTNFSKSGYLSNAMIQEISESLKRGEQSLIFLNRRGTSRMIFCEKCGWQALCPHCDLPLVYHGDGHYTQCHTCAYRSTSPMNCPDCRNATIVFKGAGTKAISDELQKIFPNNKIQRFDTDNKKSERIEEHFEMIHRGDIDIIVGTQTITKGIDLPNLGLVGIIAADTGLSFPDFSAQERNYQLLHQVMGRVGRGHRKGSVVIQTYNPDGSVLKSVLKKDWESFNKNELKERQTYKFPPYYYLLKLSCRRSTSKAAEAASQKLAKHISAAGYEVIVEGPAPSFYEKVQSKYQWQIVVKAQRRGELLKIIKELPSQWSYDIDPLNLL